MLWDVFCKVIDNFGDIGVCWRLAVDLAGRGQRVRLWVDDPGALAWMAPQVVWRPGDAGDLAQGVGEPGVTVRHWSDAERDDIAMDAGEVVIEAFGCDPPDAFVRRLQRRAAVGTPAQWINLEYLSAEDYIERSHGLASPVWSGPGAGLRKRFFYPGFTEATGGLQREPGLIESREAQFGCAQWADAGGGRARFLSTLGVPMRPGQPVILVFCYDSAPLGDLLDRLSTASMSSLVLLAPGPATRLADAWLASRPDGAGQVALHRLPALPQPDFDRLLWCADLNFVRGEDSAVRALWTGRPHVWHIYEQDDGVHAGKLEAFMDRWMAPWPEAVRQEVAAWWRAWNRLGPMPDALPAWHGAMASADNLATPCLVTATCAPAWIASSRISRAGLLAQTDLCSRLLDFVASSG